MTRFSSIVYLFAFSITIVRAEIVDNVAIKTADYIIVGGGPAGLVLAERLSAKGRNRVVLLEAGKDSKDDIFINSKAPPHP